MENKGGKLVVWTVGTILAIAFVAYMASRVIRPAALASPVPEAGALTLPDVLFYLLAAVTVAGAGGVALSRNILYSAFGLLMALLGAGSLYVLLSADFVAVTQLLIYIGGVLVLILFAVMLTSRITDVNVSNGSFGLFGGFMLFVAVAPVLLALGLLPLGIGRLVTTKINARTIEKRNESRCSTQKPVASGSMRIVCRSSLRLVKWCRM